MEKFQVSIPKEIIKMTRESSQDASTKSISWRWIFSFGLHFTLLVAVSLLCYGILHINNKLDAWKQGDENPQKELQSLKTWQNATKRFLGHLMLRPNGDKDHYNSNNHRTLLSNNETRKNIDAIKKNLKQLVQVVDNLTVRMSKSKNLSHTKILRLQTLLNVTSTDLRRLLTKVMHLNETIHEDTRQYLVSATQELRHDINGLQNWTIVTARNLSELWRRWNRTDTEVEDIIKLIRQHNETFHFKIAYHSDALSTKIKDVEKKQSIFENKNRKNELELRRALNKSESTLQRMIQKEIQQTNASFHNALENALVVLRSSVRKVDLKVDRINIKLRDNMNTLSNKQTRMKIDFSKTKAKFQDKDRKHDTAISDSNQDVARLQKKITVLQSSLDSKTRKIDKMESKLTLMEKTMNEMKNVAIGLPSFNVYHVLIWVYGMYYIFG